MSVGFDKLSQRTLRARPLPERVEGRCLSVSKAEA